MFSNDFTVQRIFNSFQTKQTYKDKNQLCAVTGEKAKYFDPLTGQYYSNVESFKVVRERYFQKEEDNLLFKIQTLSDLASQKKEKLKKLLISNPLNTGKEVNVNSNKGIMDIISKIGIMKSEPLDLEKRQITSKSINNKYILFIY